MLNTASIKVLKGSHVTFVTMVGGGFFSMLVLLYLKHSIGLGYDSFLIDLSILKIFRWVVSYAFFGILITSFIYALFTPWSFFKHDWITVKWILLIGMFILAWIWLGPSIGGMTSISDAGFQLSQAREEYLRFVNKSILFTSVELTGVIIMLFIATIKPWRVRKYKHVVNRKLMISLLSVVAMMVILFSAASFVNLSKYRNMPIADSDLTGVQDGSYSGEARVGNFTYRVEVSVLNHAITEVKVIDNRKSPYAFYAEGVFNKIIRDQNANTQAVTGATTTSKALMKAVENALIEQKVVK